LITSTGAEIVENSVFTVPNGLIFNVDGKGMSDININIGTDHKPAKCFNDPMFKNIFYTANVINLHSIGGVYPLDWNKYYKDKGAIVVYK